MSHERKGDVNLSEILQSTAFVKLFLKNLLMSSAYHESFFSLLAASLQPVIPEAPSSKEVDTPCTIVGRYRELTAPQKLYRP